MYPLIAINPEIRFGQPCIAGTRISVSDVLSWFAAGMSEQDILADFPELDRPKIRAALEYAMKQQQHHVLVSHQGNAVFVKTT